MSKTSIVTIGNAIVDIIAQTDDSFIEACGLTKGTMNLIDFNTAIKLYDAMGPAIESSGGSAANTAVGIAALGGESAFIGKVGNDTLAGIFSHDIQAAGVTFHAAFNLDMVTARSCILVTPDGQRTMSTCLAASITLLPDDINQAVVAGADIVFIEGYLIDAPMGRECYDRIAKIAADSDTRIALSLSDPLCVDRHRDVFYDFITNHVDIVIGNIDEVASLTQTSQDVALLQIGTMVEEAVVTQGSGGSTAMANGEIIHINADHDVSVVDTTGAGDLYAAGYLYARSRGASLELATRLGTIAASETISHLGARPQSDLIVRMRGAMPQGFFA